MELHAIDLRGVRGPLAYLQCTCAATGVPPPNPSYLGGL